MHLLSLVCAFLLGGPALAADAPYTPPLDKVIEDLVKADPAPSAVDQVWWMPGEFWRSAMASSPDVTPAQIDIVVNMLEPYAMFAVIEGDMGPMGAVTFRSRADVRAELTLRLPSGEVVRPLPDDRVAGDATMLVSMMKPMFTGMLGATGEHLEFFFFDNRDAKGRRLLDPASGSTFTVSAGGTPYTWQLPLESLSAPRACGLCARELSGSWSYCPYDGTPVAKAR